MKISLIYIVCFTLSVLFPKHALASPQLSENEKQAFDAYANKDFQTTHRLFLTLAKEDNVFAQSGLAKMYRYGQGVAVDYQQSVSYYQAAAKHSYGVAQSHLGEMYEHGFGVEKNLSVAKSWYQIACANACSEGCANLQRMNQESGL